MAGRDVLISMTHCDKVIMASKAFVLSLLVDEADVELLETEVIEVDWNLSAKASAEECRG